jgi:hypothetical protein
MASGSVDQRNTYVFEVSPQPVAVSVAKGLSYWSTANGDDTMVTIWNPAAEAQDFLVTVFFSGGHYKYPIHLGPKATHSFNISEIVEAQTPDAEGNIIPAGVHEGSAEISGLEGATQPLLSHAMISAMSQIGIEDQLRMHLAWRWFTGLGFDQEIPHHSTFSKNRHGRFRESKLFEQLFEQIVRQCVEVGLVEGKHLSVDSSFAEANAAKGSRIPREQLVEAAQVKQTASLSAS